jgi:hypothetical protein
MDEQYDLGQVIRSILEYGLEDVNTAIPAVILGIKNEGRNLLIDVQPSINIRTREEQVIPRSSVLNVPMQQPASSQGGLIFPVKVGDSVLLVFSMRGIDRWKYGSGSPEAPSDFRKFDKKDCVAIPCIFPSSRSVADPVKHGSDYELGDVCLYNNLSESNYNEVVLKKNGGVVVNCKTAVVNASQSMQVNTPDFTINTSTYRVNADSYYGTATTFNMTGSWILNGIAMETHTHGGVEPGAGSTGVPQ